MAQLTLQVLGMPRVQVDGTAVHIARRRTLACAIYLAVTGQAQSRETLAALFWPEENQQNARADLRRTLHLLHRTFGTDRLLVDHDAVRLIHDQHLWLDIEHFHRLLAVCQQHNHAAGAVCPACLPPLAAAAALYRDDFLAGFTLPDSPDFDQWQFQQGEALRAELASALERLVRGYTAQQEWEQAIAYARRWLALDPLHEGVQRWLMRLYAWSGQQSAAQRQYRDCVQLLDQELGVAPEAETQQIQRLIKQHKLPLLTLDQLAVASAAVTVPSGTATTGLPTEDEVRLLTVVCAGLRPLPFGEEDLEQEAANATHLATLATAACAPYGGQVEPIPGGDLLLTFGRDQIHEDDPERALRTALALQAAAAVANLPVQIGVNTGLAYCSSAGAATTATIMGAVVKLAGQLRSRAASGQLLAGKATYQATRSSFVASPVELNLTGGSVPLTVYQIHRLQPHTTKARGVEGLGQAFIGRAAEFAHLQNALAQVLAGRGHLVLISGAAGVGKSRLVSELKNQWRVASGAQRKLAPQAQRPSSGLQSPILWLEGRCLPFALTASYALFVDALRGYLSEGDEGEAGLAAQLVRLLQTLTDRNDLTAAQQEEMGPLLGQLLSVRFGNEWDERLQSINPAQVRHQTFQTVITLLAALARHQPLVLLCEDLHWADALSLALLTQVIEQLPHLPLLVICVYRPEGAQAGEPLAALAAQQASGYYTQITLGELPSEQSGQLLATLLAGAELPAVTRELILTTAQGNPFFLEEIVRNLIERRLLYRAAQGWQVATEMATVTAPDTVQQVVLSRVDQLAAPQQRLLQSASVIGRLFRPRLLTALLPAESKLDQLLADLTDQAFIYQERSLPEREYSFRHVLMQDAIYHALPGRRRAKLHQQVAEALETLYADDRTAYVEQIAYHYEQSPAASQTTGKAIEFLLLAGRKAQRAFLPTAALGYYQRALARLTAGVETPAYASWLLESYHGLAYTYLQLSDFATAARYERQAIIQAQVMGLPPREQARYYGWLCRVLRAHGELDAVIHTGAAGLALLGDDQQCWEAAVLNGNMADAYSKQGQRQQFRTIMAHVRAFLPPAPCTTGAIFVTYGHLVTLCLERKDLAAAMMWWSLTAQGLQANNDLSPLSWTHTWVAVWLYEAQGDSVAIERHCQLGLDLARQTGITYDLARGLVARAEYHFGQGDLAQAAAYIHEAQPYRAQFGAQGELADGSDLLARIAYCRGDLPLATTYAEESLALVAQSGFTFAQPTRQIFLGQLYLAQSQPERALAQFHLAIAGEPVDGKGLPVLAAALASAEAVYAEPTAFHAYCRQVQADKPDFALQQWWLEAARADEQLTLVNDWVTPGADWEWIDPFGDCRWQATADGLVIEAINRRDLWVNNVSAPRLLRPVTGDFALQVLCCAVADQPAIGGLLLWQDQQHYLRLTWGEYGAAAVTFVGCIANEDQILGRGRLLHKGQIHLRLERVGGQVRALCSADGQTWFCAGQVTIPWADTLAVGLHAIGKLDRTFYPGAYGTGTAIHFTACSV